MCKTLVGNRGSDVVKKWVNNKGKNGGKLKLFTFFICLIKNPQKSSQKLHKVFGRVLHSFSTLSINFFLNFFYLVT